ncbi:MAG: hypothetical protein ACK5PC_15465 [Cyclobacteriaceae bacterium]
MKHPQVLYAKFRSKDVHTLMLEVNHLTDTKTNNYTNEKIDFNDIFNYNYYV